jgi:hypothetical protein
MPKLHRRFCADGGNVAAAGIEWDADEALEEREDHGQA